ncbi:MAG TPA: class I SAM-dependent methyltransferase [Limnobacter sp.]|nr:class I SAM-dependent methyltransferase [Limnobacter sp.]
MHQAHEYPEIRWTRGEETVAARWQSERQLAPPSKVLLADDTLTADTAYRLACEGNVFLWQSDFQNARQLLQALVRRVDKNAEYKKSKAAKAGKTEAAYPQKFHLFRQAQAQRARILGSILIPVNADYSISLRRAPDMSAACAEAWGKPQEDGPMIVVSLREIMGVVGAHEWRKKGVEVAALGNPPANRIHPYYGVFSPVRGEYIDLVLKAPLPKSCEVNGSAMDVGTGTGVLAAVLAQRWLSNIVATDINPRALECAQFNIQNLGLGKQVNVTKADMFAEGKADLVLCNPPWLPGKPTSPLEHAIYDENSQMLKAYIAGLSAHLNAGGEGWLILSDLAEHLKLRSREDLLGWIETAGLKVAGRLDAKPRHGKAFDSSDPLFDARSKEVTSLWRLVAQ